MRLPKKALLMMAIALLAGIILLFVWPGPKNIHEAVYARDVAAVKRFIETGVDLDAVNKDGYTPLHIAASGDFPEIIEILIDGGAEIEKVDKK